MHAQHTHAVRCVCVSLALALYLSSCLYLYHLYLYLHIHQLLMEGKEKETDGYETSVHNFHKASNIYPFIFSM